MAVKKIGTRPFDRAIATSSTAAAVVCAVNRIPRARREEASKLRATTPQVKKLFRTLSERDLSERKLVQESDPGALRLSCLEQPCC